MSIKTPVSALIITFVLLGILFPCRLIAVPAAPKTHTLLQPDGEAIVAQQWGDEYRHGFETPSGRTIVQDTLTRQWTYAVRNWDGNLTSSGVRVTNDSTRKTVERGFTPHLRPTPDHALSQFAASVVKAPPRFQISVESLPLHALTTGSANIPVILANFANTSTAYTAQDFTTLLFGTGNWSMNDYYQEVSYGKFTVTAGPQGVSGWYRITNAHDYYGTNSGGGDAYPGDVVYEAVAQAEAAGFNFAPYDQNGDCYVDVVAIVHQGTGEEASGTASDIWSHRWSLYAAQYWGRNHYGVYVTASDCIKGGKIMVNDYIIQPEKLWGGLSTMGVFAHEYGHSLGLPDLYDVDNSSQGVGNWSLMAGGSWGRVSVSGDRPAHMDPWSKYKLGWVAPTQVAGTLTNQAIQPASSAADVYQIRSGSPASGGEYFLVENRQKSGFDAGLPGSGLMIWHIDEAKASASNSDNASECYPGGPACASQHYRVAVVQADNLWNLEKNNNRGDGGDPFPGTSNRLAFNATSAPNSNLYSGAASHVAVIDINAAATPMTATLSSLGGAKPDFVVTAATLTPATPTANGSFSATITVKNQGAAPGDGGTLMVWANQATTQTCGATGDQSVTVGTVAAGASVNLTVDNLPAGAVGTKTLRAVVDNACAVSEATETNNQLTKNYAAALPDFVVTAITLTPAIPTANGTFNATVTVKNQGTAAGTVGEVAVWAHQTTAQTCGATGDQSQPLGNLAAGASTTLNFTGLPAGALGSKTFRAVVDNACANPETNDTNNQLTKTYSTALPDFVVTAITLTPATPTANSGFNVAVTVKNQGTAPGVLGTVSVWANQTTATTCGATGEQSAAVGSLAAGATTTLNFTGLNAGTAGARTFRAVVDNACANAEANETNNQLTKSYTSALPDFVITAVTLNPTTPTADSTFTAAITVKNQGVAPGDGGMLMVWSHQSTAQGCGTAGDKSIAVGTLAAGASITLNVTELPSGAVGAKVLRAAVDNDCMSPETNETNNQFTKTYSGALPDFVVTGVAFNPATPPANGSFTATVTIKNQGTAPGAGGKLAVWGNQATAQTCGASGDQTVSFGALAAGASVAISVPTLPAGTVGAKTLRVLVDSDCTTPEANDSNNEYTKAYTTTLSDFVVTAMAISPTSPTANGSFRARITIKNQGAAADNGGVLTVWAHQATVPACGAAGNISVNVGTLGAGQTKTLTVSGLPAGTAGSKTIRAFVDSQCATLETSDTNNQLAQSYQVAGLPDVVVTGITLDAPTAEGVFSATVTVKNQGTVASAAGWMDIWADAAVTQPCYAAGDAFVAVDALAAGASATYVVEGIPAGAAGTKTLRAFVDSYCQIVESDEVNNQYVLGYTLP